MKTKKEKPARDERVFLVAEKVELSNQVSADLAKAAELAQFIQDRLDIPKHQSKTARTSKSRKSIKKQVKGRSITKRRIRQKEVTLVSRL